MGLNHFGEATPPSGTDTYIQVSVGGLHTCAIKTGGTLACWGDDRFGQLEHIPSGSFTQVSAGGEHTCAIKTDGTVACWGSNEFGEQLDHIPSGSFTQVSAGNLHTCAVTTSGRWICWGDNTSGQSTPDGAPTITTQPSDLAVLVGQPATFTVAASNPDTLSYQWYFSSDGTTFTPIGGATGSSYTIPATALTDAGYYKVAVDSSSAEIQSRAAKLTVYKGTITITASSPTIAYGDPITITPSYSGLIAPDTADTALSTKPTCGTTATSTSPPGTYTTSCSGAASSTYAIKYVDGSLTITQGTVTITSDPANSTPKPVSSTGGTASFTLKATVKDGDGDISTALPATYTLTPIGPGSSYTCTDSTGSGVTDGVLSSSCAFTGVAPNVYTLTISVNSTTYTGSTTDTVTVIDQGLAFATGSGTVSHDGTTGKFLLTAEYKQGTLTGTFKYTQGNEQLTSSSLRSLAVVRHGPNGPIAYVSGTATDQNGTSYSFRVTAIDGGLASNLNQLGLSVTDATGQPVPALSFDPVKLSCGDIVIGSPTSLAARMLGFTTGLLGWTYCQ